MRIKSVRFKKKIFFFYEYKVDFFPGEKRQTAFYRFSINNNGNDLKQFFFILVSHADFINFSSEEETRE